MHDTDQSATPRTKRAPWNKGKLTGAKPPLRPKHVWAIRTMLQNDRQARDLALFNLAIDSKLRGCDVVAVRVDDVAPTASAMRDFISVAMLCLLGAFVTDRLWLGGKYSGNVTPEWLLDFSSMKHH